VGGKPELVQIVNHIRSWCATAFADVPFTFSYAEAPEILEYFKGCAVKWGCMEYIKLNHRVVEARWSEEDAQWHLTIDHEGIMLKDQCHLLLSATGILK